MADEVVPIHPVAPRMTNAGKTPHIGPHIGAYREAHAKTVGHESDHWWAKVRPSSSMSHVMFRSYSCSTDGPGNPSLGSPIPDCSSWRIFYWRYCVVPRGRVKRILQLRRPLGIQAPEQSMFVGVVFHNSVLTASTM